jgi:hypothetical protein
LIFHFFLFFGSIIFLQFLNLPLIVCFSFVLF